VGVEVAANGLQLGGAFSDFGNDGHVSGFSMEAPMAPPPAIVKKAGARHWPWGVLWD